MRFQELPKAILTLEVLLLQAKAVVAMRENEFQYLGKRNGEYIAS